MRIVEPSGDTVYRLASMLEPTVPSSMTEMIRSIDSNGSLIVIKTSTGSASLVAHHLDRHRPAEILGTIAGDDTIFVAPVSTMPRKISETISAIEASLAIE